MEILNWIIANKVAVGGAAIAAILGGGKAIDVIKAIIAKFTSKPVAGVIGNTDVSTEVADQDAIRHLRSRASALKNAKLIAVIKEADSIFYDIHAGITSEKEK